MTIFSYAKYFPVNRSPNRSGVIKAVHGFAVGLAESGEAVTILSEGPQSVSIPTAFGYKHHSFRNPNTAPSLKLAPDLQQFVRQRMTPQDLVILNGGFHLSVYALSRLLRQQGIPYVAVPHLAYDRAMFAKSPHQKYPYWYLCERRMLQQARAIQVFDQSQATWLRRRGIHTPMIEVYNGFHPANQPMRSSLAWTRAASIKLMFFGRLSRHTKGLDLLLESFARCTTNRNLMLTLQGEDQGDRQFLQRQVQRLGLEHRVTFLEANYEQSPMTLMKDYDIICLPSRSEGFGLAALEAMLAGRVLLVSDVSGIAQHVQASGCGVVVRPTVQSIQAGLEQLLQRQDEWSTMGRWGYDYASSHLSWRQVVQSAIQNYQQLIPTWQPTQYAQLIPLSV